MTSQVNKPLLYVAREIERALGKTPGGNYYIVTNRTSYSEEIQKQYPDNILLINSKETLDTHELLILPEVQEIISRLHPHIIVFKNTIHIEQLCKENGWDLLNPSAELSEKVENKITQVDWLNELASLLPPHTISLIKDVVWQKKAFVLQWSHGHTGDGTLLIQNENDIKFLQEKFPFREARITDFIKGPMFTVNIVVTNTTILLGNISYQITGMLPFTENPFSTIGNDWSVTHTILHDAHIKKIEEMAEKVAHKIQSDGWKGLFGIDIIYDEERDMIHLIEINARQPASTTFESEIQSLMRSQGVAGITTFEAHLNALQNIPVTIALIPINDGAQVVQRLTKILLLKNEKDNEYLFNTNKLIDAGYRVISYKNTKPNSDLLRIQSMQGIMETHTKLNKRGKEIVEALL